MRKLYDGVCARAYFGEALSPFEKRIAIIYSYDSYVSEGDWSGSYDIIGAHLETGFVK